MSRARVLSEYANFNSLAVDTTDNEVGIASTVPRSTLDVRGELKVGTAIQAGTAGVVTATEFSGSIGTFSGAGSFGGNLDVTGNVTIGGTLTYEDVTNIDSVGIVTARAGVNVSGGQITVGVAYSVGNAGVVTATGYHGGSAENVWTLGASGTSHYTFTGPGDLSAATDPTLNLVRGQRYRFKNRSGGHPFQIQREYQNTSGTAYNDGVTNNAAANGTDLIFDVPYDAPAILYYQCTSHANMSGYLYIGGSGYETKIGTGITIGSAGVGTFADGSTSTNALKFGSSGDLSIYHDGSHSYIKDSGTGELRLSTSQFTVQNAAGNETLLYAVDNAGVGLKYQDSLKFETTSGGAQVTGTLEVTSYISQNDGIWHYWGTGDDLGIQHDGSNAIIRNGTGNIRIEPKNGELGVRCIPDGTTELYFDNSKKFETTNDGTVTTGIGTFTEGLRLADSKKLIVGTGNDLQIYTDGSNSAILHNGDGDLLILAEGSGEDIKLKAAENVDLYVNTTEIALHCDKDGAVQLRHNNNTKLETASGGISVTGSVTATNYLGDGSALTGIGGDMDITSSLFV